ncbi:hypothetical protein [Streptomyces boluensis]|uniref:Uncharacterized protein n=1 Tax=Streptomyces boluensis TaxID=1775135 RepID=A0A964UMA7_9ACTN|nr:hypothetical protein [Streptomyces boluensis]NBE50765.1 hypothetical protein [Streptomyces boluensis]
MPNDVPPADAMPQASASADSHDRPLPPIDWAAVRERKDRLRKRRRIIGGTAGATLIAAVSIGTWITAGDEKKQPIKHTAELPTEFADYRLAGQGQSLWDKTGTGENLDPSSRTAHATYVRADSRKSFMITLDLDPSIDMSDPGEGDDAVSALLGTSVESGEAKSYDPGPIGGKLRCVRYEVANTTSSRCIWGNHAATVTAQPVITSGPRPAPRQTAAEVRTFLAELHVRAVKSR